MARNKIDDLNNHLFMAIEMLFDKDSDMTTEKAKAIAELAQTLINAAKVQNDFLKLQGADRIISEPELFNTKKQLTQ